ncbi:hypothetical protein, partial [Faecalicoccus pleomorphus]|uniref:hypothetical protein n=1 Tax=Faecalicoccus pleomorphus TaxID=1323 RepID=UPI003F6550EB
LIFLSNRKAEQILEILEKKYDTLLEKEEEEEVRKMCTFSEALIEKGELRGETKGTIKGILQGKADSVLQLVKNHIASNIEQAMDMLSVDEKMRSDIERILENR